MVLVSDCYGKAYAGVFDWGGGYCSHMLSEEEYMPEEYMPVLPRKPP